MRREVKKNQWAMKNPLVKRSVDLGKSMSSMGQEKSVGHEYSVGHKN